MAKKNYKAAEAVELYINNYRFDAIRIVENGEIRLSQTQVLSASRLPKNFLARINSHTPGKARKLKDRGFSGEIIEVRFFNGRSYSFAKTLSLEDAKILWYFLDREYHDPKLEAVLSGKVYNPQKVTSSIKIYSEKWYQRKLKALEGGQAEVVTPAGNIDLLTSSELIEIKKAILWKEGIGQLIVYGCYYPSHQKRLHLFGSCHTSFLEIVQEHCDSLSIRLTWE